MRNAVVLLLGFLSALCLGPPALAVQQHAFEPPPTLPGQQDVLTGAAPAFNPSPAAPGSQPMAHMLAPPATPSGRAAEAPDCMDGAMSRRGSVVRVRLDFVRAHFTINNPDPTDPQPGHEDPVELRSYGGCKSGPAVTVYPGDSLHFDLVNRTSRDDPSCYEVPPAGLGLPAGVGCFNTTNLHTHGLHVSPAGNGDNVLLNIAPQTRFPYEVNIPADHPAGTFWYHAHRHGSTAVQVASGASGVLVIKGVRPYTPPTRDDPHPVADIDTVLHDAHGTPFDEKLFLFQQIAYACFANTPNLDGGPWQHLYTASGLYSAKTDPKSPINTAPWTCPLPLPGKPVSPGVVENFGLQLDSPSIWDTNGRFTSINGVVQPTITVPAGEIQRWRFVHAGIHDTINLQLVRAAGPIVFDEAALSSIPGGRLALAGNRLEQKADLLKLCDATPASLIPQFEIASDGLTRTRIHTIHAAETGAGLLESNYLQPGYRSDILAVFPAEGDYCLLDQAAPEKERATSGAGGQGPSTPQLLAYIHVQGGHPVTTDLEQYVENALADANAGTLPPGVDDALRHGDLTAWAPFTHLPAADSGDVQHADFAINFPLFTINGKSYDPNVINITRQVDTTDDWVLSSQGEPHIFHIHVNPFEVTDVRMLQADGQYVSIFDGKGNCRQDMVTSDGQGLANQYCGMYHVFRDTIIVENALQVHIRTKYETYIGEYVIHCHILDHEDSGMMLNVAIVPDLNAPGGGLGMAGMHHAMGVPPVGAMKGMQMRP